jgi:hypothetical protein
VSGSTNLNVAPVTLGRPSNSPPRGRTTTAAPRI